MNEQALNLMDFIDNSPTMFHVVDNVEKILLENNFTYLDEKDKWNLVEDGRYFTKKSDASIIAFHIGKKSIEEEGFRLIGSHTDSPCFKIKPLPEILVEDTYVKLNTEVYGGPILSTWFDRPLGIAGKVVLKSENILKPIVKLMNIDRPVTIIPSLAIHLSREMDNNGEINKQKDILPLIGLIDNYLEKDNLFIKLVAEELDVDIEEILDFELYLYDYTKGNLTGASEEFMSIGRLDNLWMVYSTLMGLFQSSDNKATKIGVFLNNEEIGSKTQTGADSVYLRTILKRIMLSFEKNEEDFYRALSNSIMISADLAHGVHPNFAQKHDPTNRPVLGKGIAIKYSSNRRYMTDANTGGLIISLCQENDIPYQTFVNRSDMRGGSTMGAFFASSLSIPIVDLGCVILSMHSIRELGATDDVLYSNELFKAFYEV